MQYDRSFGHLTLILQVMENASKWKQEMNSNIKKDKILIC